MTRLSAPGSLITRADPVLFVVRSYLDLISTSQPPKGMSGLAKVFALTRGAPTLNDDELLELLNDTKALGLLPTSWDNFTTLSINRNCAILAHLLKIYIRDRIVAIANGEIQNPQEALVADPSRTRRSFYTPPTTFVNHFQRTLDFNDPGDTIATLRNNAIVMLTQVRGAEGQIFPGSNPLSPLYRSVETLVSYMETTEDTKTFTESRDGLTVLWVIGKMLFGDLTMCPDAADHFPVNVSRTFKISDGTLAAIPFPTIQTLQSYHEPDCAYTVSLKAQQYIDALAHPEFQQFVLFHY